MGYKESHMLSLRINKRNFFVPQVHSVDSWGTRYQIHSQCPRSPPNSCDITLKLRKDASFSNFKIFAEIKRTDNGEDCPAGALVIRIQNMEGKKSPVKYVLACDLKGHETASKEFEIVDEHFKCLLREDDEVTFPADVLIVKTRLIVLCRHA
ncbi:hypothetical protein AVEN_66603-1 [Araneus ventricosus]|uniref:Uncharacterized protein n=1 Tax=Araneus ventricosus TaxID=182803 RepID=A0A4Y2M4F7_ARAVE|nr:hypothetical protein AVEN_66603-1 [Araneus ventricosus]